MPVSNQIPLNESLATPGATVFPYGFKVLRKSDMLVTVNGEEKLVDVDYTIDGLGSDSGGNITFAVPMIGGELVMRRRNMPLERQTDFQNLGDLRSATLNNDQDAPILMIQQVNADLQKFLSTDPTALAVSSAEAASISEWHSNQHRLAAAASEADAEAAAATAVAKAAEAEQSADLAEQSRLLGAAIGFATKLAMDSDLAHPAGKMALVTNDSTPENNRPYRKTGSSGSGSWVPSEDRTTVLYGRVGEIADESATLYYDGDEVFKADIDSDGRATIVTLIDGSVKIPKLVMGPSQRAQIAETAAAAVQRSLWPGNALEALAFAAFRCVDLVMIGDSNQAMNGYGYGAGLHKALAARFGCYATGVGAAAPSAHSEYTNNAIETLTPMSAGAYTGAGSAADAIVPPHQRLGYSYWASGELEGSTLSGVGRIRIKNGGGLDPSAPLRVHYAWISTDTGAGSFRIGARLAVSPYTAAASGVTHDTNTGEVSLHRDWLDIPAGSRSGGLEVWWARPGAVPITGPMCAVSMRVEDTAKESGVSVSTFYAAGGQSLYDMAEYALTAPDGTLSHWFGEVRRLQVARGLKPIVVFYINSGLNDRNETSSPSLGWRGSTDPDGPEAYLDNLDALVKRIRDIWQKNGWAQEELFFLLVPSHPVSNPDDAELRAYRGACVATWAAQLGVSVVDFTNLTTSTEILNNGWYQSGGSDTNHLENAGYDELSARIIDLVPEIDE